MNSVKALGTLAEGDEVSMPGFDGMVLKGRINRRQVESSGQVIIGGQLTGGQAGTFSFSLSRAGLNGSILLPDKATAYVVGPLSVAGVPRLMLSEKPIAEVVCFPLPVFSGEVPPQQADPPGDGGGTPAAAVVPILSSRPGATAVLYMDFDGETVTDPSWNGGRTIEAKPTTLTSEEIAEVWWRVAEDYAGFDIDVTTDVTRYNTAPVGRRMRCIVTPTDTAWPGSGGVAYLNSFAEAGRTFSETIPCWVFNPGVIGVAEAVSHEFGHTFGLRHDGRTNPQEEYYFGHGEGDLSWAPIMGVGYYKKIVQWSRGEYAYANNHEDDLAVIASPINGFGYSADEAGESVAAAATFSPGTIGQVFLEGIVQNTADTDDYQFTAPAGLVRIEGAPAATSPNLDMVLELKDAGGTVLASSNPGPALGAALSHALPAGGTYFLSVKGTGQGDPLTDGYSNYGSVGAYSLRGAIPVGDGIPFIEPGIVDSLPRSIAANYQIPAANSPTSYAATGLPEGMVLDPATGLITGIPTAVVGSYTVTVTLTNALGSRGGTFVVTLTPEPAPTITAAAVVLARQGKSFSLGIAATALPNSYAVTGLPTGLSLNGTTGVISGTPTVTGSFPVTVSATNATGTGTAPFTIAVVPQFQSVAGGSSHSLMVHNDGTLWATGLNSSGQLGDGTTVTKSVPVPIATGVASVAAGDNFSLFLKNDSTLWATGLNGFGQLGDGTTVTRSLPVPIATGVTSVAAGSSHSLFLKADGSLWAMGNNSQGQLGDGTNTSRYAPVQIVMGVAAIACGTSHSLYIKTDGTLWAMGGNSNGQLGDGTKTTRNTPVQVAEDVFSVTGSSGGTLFIKNDATLWGMGYNGSRHLGGSNSDQTTPLKVAEGVIAGAAGWQASHFLKADGTLWMTGYDGMVSHLAPIQMASGVSLLSVSLDNLLYMSVDGRFWGRGQNQNGRLGDGTYSDRTLPVLVAEEVASMSAGRFHSLFIKDDQSLWAAGANFSGQLGDGSRLTRGTPVKVASAALQSAGGYDHSLFIKSDGALWGMGTRQEGQLKGMSFGVQSPPAAFETGVTAIAAGYSFSLYLKADGVLWATGGNTHGQLGDGTLNKSTTGVLVAAGVAGMAAGFEHSLFVKTDGTLWVTGRNDFGQLGDGTNADRSTPTLIATAVSKAAAAIQHSLFLKTDGTLWAMGSNISGQLGDGTMTNRSLPVQVAGDVAAIAVNDSRSYFIKSDGTLWAMGSGHGTSPARIARGVAKVAANGHHLFYLKIDGSLWAMGDNLSGQLGDGTEPFVDTPVEIMLGRPGFVTQVMPFEVDLGGWVTFSVTATGTGPLLLQWRKDGTAIPGATGSSYTISGAQASDGGVYDVVVTNGVGSATSTAGALTVLGVVPQFTSASAFTAPRLVPLMFRVTAANDVSSFGAVGLPDGLVIDASSGLISGIPTAAADTYPVTLTATNAYGDTSATLTITLGGEPAPVISSGVTAVGRRGLPLTYAILATPLPQSYGATGLPAGLAINTATGVITGIPTAAPGVYTVTLAAVNGAGAGNQTLRLAILAEWQDRVSGGVYSSFFLEDDGTLWAAGYNYFGQLGEGSTVNRASAVRVATDVASVASGIAETLFIKTDGTLWGMGWNVRGALGLGHGDMQMQPVLLGTDTIAAAAGFGYSLVLKANGSLWAAGQNNTGSLGDGTTEDRYQHVLVANGVTSIAANGAHSLFIKGDGTLWGMGSNHSGELGDGTQDDRITPVQIATGVKAVSAAPVTSLFLKTDGSLWGMGFNGANQLKTRAESDALFETIPLKLAEGVIGLAAGPNQHLYLKADGTLWGRGYNGWGQLGDQEKQFELEARQLATDVVACATGQYHSIYRKADGTLWTLGSSSAGELADGRNTEQPVPAWIASEVKQVAAGADHSLFVTNNGDLWGMGYNGLGSLGDRTRIDRVIPVRITGQVASATSNFWHNLLIKTDGTLWAMGNNGDGQLGNGAIGNVDAPQQVDVNVRRAATGGWHSLYLRNDGTAWAMGYNGDGQLGDGTNVQKTLPGQVMTDVTEIAAGYRHSLFLKSNGSLWATGLNDQGQLGDGTTTSRQTPVQVATGVTQIAANGWHSLFLKTDGSLWAMGYNQFGQLGDGSSANRSTPFLVDVNVRTVAAGFYHTQYVKADGTLWAMGDNSVGQLGDGAAADRTDAMAREEGSPAGGAATGASGGDVTLATVDLASFQEGGFPLGPNILSHGAAPRVSAASSSRAQSAQSTGGGSLVVMNSVELLGSGTPSRKYRSVQIATGVAGVSAGGNHSLYVRTNDTLWAMGGSYYGRLGNGAGVVAWQAHQVRLGLPAILFQSIPFAVHLNQRVELLVTAVGAGTLTYQWRKDGQPISGATATRHSLPIASAADGGVYDVVVTNSLGSRACTAVNLSVVDAPPAFLGSLAVSIPRMADGIAFRINANNDATAFAATGLPPGLSLDARTGIISGRIEAAEGVFPVTITATNANGSSTATLNITVTTQAVPVMTSAGTVLGRQGQALRYVATAQNSPQTFSAANLPAGLAMDSASGVISGRITAPAGRYTATVSATNVAGVASRAVTFIILPESAGLAAGQDHSLVVDEEGVLWAMGGNSAGKLGDGTTVDRGAPVRIATDVVAADGTESHSLFIKSDGTLWGMGHGGSGQLGSGANSITPSPVQIATRVQGCAAGSHYSLYVDWDGTAWATGANYHGQLGDGTLVARTSPVQLATAVDSVSAGLMHSLWVKQDGTLWAAGWNGDGQLGDGTTIDRLSPVQIATGVRSVSAGSDHTLYVGNDGTLWAMGNNWAGKLGDGTNISRSTPVIAGTGVVRAFAGASASLYLTTDGDLWGVGENAYGGLRDGGGPIHVKLRSGVAGAAIGGGHSLFVDASGSVFAAGYNGNGQLGDLTVAYRSLPGKVTEDVARVSPGDYHTMFIRDDLSLWGLGNHYSSQRGAGINSGIYTLDMLAAPGVAPSVQEVSASGYYTLFIDSGRTLWGMGQNMYGEIGRAAIDVVSPPWAVASEVVAVAAGRYHSLFLKENRTLWVSGSNVSGQLGDGTNTNRLEPVMVAGDVVKMVTGSSHSLFLKADGSLWGMGSNWSHEINASGVSGIITPMQIATGVATMAAGNRTSFFVKGDGTLWAMGINDAGQLGNGTKITVVSPVQIATGVSAVSAGESAHAVFLKTDGTLWAMGSNSFGQLGDGTTTDRLSPVLVATGVASIAAGTDRVFFLKRDHTLWSTGSNTQGRLGVSTVLSRREPVRIRLGIPVVSSISIPVGASLGGTVLMSVAATGSGNLAYQWRKNGSPIIGATGSGHLIGVVTADDGGVYDVVITGTVGSTISPAGSMAVLNAVPVIHSPLTLPAYNGSAFSYRVAANNDASTFGATGLPAGLVINTETGLISGVPAGAAGHHLVTLSAANQQGTTQAVLDMEITAQPIIARPPVSQAVWVGQTTSLTVSLAGTGAFSYQWWKDGVSLSGATGATLTLPGVQAIDSGTYWVVATNPAGSITSNGATLTVNPAPPEPVIRVQPLSQTVIRGSVVTFYAAASGTPAPTYQWRKNDMDIPGATSATLTLPGALTDAGSYTMVATNSVGSATSDPAILTVRPMTADFTGDGKPDLVWQNRNSGERGFWVMNGTTVVTYVSLTSVDAEWQVSAYGDFNGDGQPDLVWSNPATGERKLWLMNGMVMASEVTLATVGTEWEIAGVADFNADGKPDIVWQNTISGQRGMWLMDGATVGTFIEFATVGTEWQICATADFNQDGKPDLVWQNTISGERGIWLMNGTSVGTYIAIATVGTEWSIMDAADFDGDGKPDIVWQNAISGERGMWLMDGTSVGTYIKFADVGTEWTLGRMPYRRAVADFNADNSPDIIWSNTVTGERGFWIMSGTTVGTFITFATVGTEWRIAGSADFNADSKADIIWENTVTGERGFWIMNGTSVGTYIKFADVGTEWRIAGSADFNADSKPDIIWENTVTGERGFWIMNGTSVGTYIKFADVGLEWRIGGVADFNADSKPDIIWENTTTGERGFWVMNGIAVGYFQSFATLGTEWELVGAADFNRDGKSDIIRQNTLTGERGVWFMNGMTADTYQSFATVGTEWQIGN
ncbi:MAG: putative Ig domain-containing protein [Phycisphaerae bacterium]